MVLGCPVIHLVRFIRYVVDGVGSIDAHAPLDAAADPLAEHPGHVLLLVQVFGILVNVRKAADSFAGEMRNGGAQVLVPWFDCFIKSGTDGVETVHLALIRAVNELTIIVDVPLHLGQALYILLLCPHFPSFLITN